MVKNSAAQRFLNDIVETPALKSLLPKVRGKSIADLGCGTGTHCHWLAEHGAAAVTGYDPSARMLEQARAAAPTMEREPFTQSTIERLTLRDSSLDLIVSALAFHYVTVPFDTVAARLFAALRPGGSLVFSTEHPVITCYDRQWHHDADGKRVHWPLDCYLDEGSRGVCWLGCDDVPRQHRTIATYVNALLAAGFLLHRLLEPGPGGTAIAQWPHLADHVRRPAFLVIRADRPG